MSPPGRAVIRVTLLARTLRWIGGSVNITIKAGWFFYDFFISE
jgi:hypothetical protein